MLGCSDIRCSTLLCYAPADAKLLYYTMLSTQKKLSVYMHACMHADSYIQTNCRLLKQRGEIQRERERERDDTNTHNHTHTHTHMHACMRITCICKKLQCARLPLALSENLHVGMRLYLYIHTHTHTIICEDRRNNRTTHDACPPLIESSRSCLETVNVCSYLTNARPVQDAQKVPHSPACLPVCACTCVC